MRRSCKLRPALAQLAQNEDGAAALEFAIVAAAFVGMCIGTIQFGMALQVRNNLAQAADRGIRLIVLDPEESDAVLEGRIAALLSEYSGAVVDVGIETVNSVNYRTVAISYELPIAVPGLDVSLLTLSASRKVPVPSSTPSA